MATLIQATVYFRPGKEYGEGRSAYSRHTRIVGGWRAEVIDGLPDGEFAYTGVCSTREAAINELIGSLKSRGLSGKLRVS